jgi:uncharacterized membrane protein
MQYLVTQLLFVLYKAMLLAPLGSAGLIFNVIFSNILLGSKISRFDVLGTLFIIVGGVLVSYFGAMEVGSESVLFLKLFIQ